MGIHDCDRHISPLPGTAVCLMMHKINFVVYRGRERTVCPRGFPDDRTIRSTNTIFRKGFELRPSCARPEGRSWTQIIPRMEEGRGMSPAPTASVVLSSPGNPL